MNGLRADFDAFKEVLSNFASDDSFTLAVERWVFQFEKELQGAVNPDKVHQLYLEAMTKLCHDQTSRKAPLEEISYLCSDGYVYGKKALSVYLTEEPLGRSPVNITDTRRFYVLGQHKVAEFAVGFLLKQGITLFPNSEVEKKYRELAALNSTVNEEEALLRRRLKVELQEFISVADQSRSLDVTTILIRDWANRFLTLLKTSKKEKDLLNEWISFLQEICKDLRGEPLEMRSFLGSDGNCYGYKALLVYLSKIPKEFEGRSPFLLDQEDLFSVVPHVTVELAMKWLYSWKKDLTVSKEIENSYQELISSGNLPKIPDPQWVKRRARAQAFLKEKKKAMPLDTNPKSDISTEDPLKEIDNEIKKRREKEKKLLDQLKTKTKERLRRVQEEFKRWDADVKFAENILEKHQEKLDELGSQISKNEKDTEETRSLIQSTTQAIQAREGEQNNGLLITLGTTALSFAIKAAFPELPATVTPAPAQGGGADPYGAVLDAVLRFKTY